MAPLRAGFTPHPDAPADPFTRGERCGGVVVKSISADDVERIAVEIRCRLKRPAGEVANVLNSAVLNFHPSLIDYPAFAKGRSTKAAAFAEAARRFLRAIQHEVPDFVIEIAALEASKTAEKPTSLAERRVASVAFFRERDRLNKEALDMLSIMHDFIAASERCREVYTQTAKRMTWKFAQREFLGGYLPAIFHDGFEKRRAGAHEDSPQDRFIMMSCIAGGLEPPTHEAIKKARSRYLEDLKKGRVNPQPPIFAEGLRDILGQFHHAARARQKRDTAGRKKMAVSVAAPRKRR